MTVALYSKASVYLINSGKIKHLDKKIKKGKGKESV